MANTGESGTKGGRSTMLHRYAMFVVGCIVVLIFFGGQVKSTSSGLAVPDWPNTYGHFMFAFPWEKMVGGIFWEHMHRVIASVVGLLTFGLTIWIYIVEKERKWVRTIALWASIAVLIQGIFGGLTVIYLLPVWASGTHGTLAQIYFCLVATIAMVTSPRWIDNPERMPDSRGKFSLRNVALGTTIVIFMQLVIGAIMRHSEAGLVIPDFPMMFGSWVPPLSAESIEHANQVLMRTGLLSKADLTEVTFGQMFIHLLHRAWAVVVSGMIIWTFVKVWRNFSLKEFRRPALYLLFLLIAQVTLGILTILTEKQFTITTLHVVTGALTLVTSLILTVQTWHLLYAPSSAPEQRVVPQLTDNKVVA